ncbi:site-specific DNA-methyltransferase [Deinococcus sp. SDU3-2]|uniref:Site-specific DNA-methyltransferase n=1 Tax=Deinococcus terrestris TaxID=2651870 RepID=A0A7X1TSP9_9DEIO|nr:DNA methyltransferase [Deinococcus terrestris]MPY68068.1 site-specific DNA-methyltransferase [Deinococcus terrestris]
MSRLTDLLQQARKADPQLANDLEAEFRSLTQRRTFGLVFEPHQPEAVELPNRPVRKGDKVRVLPPRGKLERGDQRLWRVQRIDRSAKRAELVEVADAHVEEPQTTGAALENLVVVAEFRDPIYPGLVETGRVERGGDKPFHTVINAENFHALELLTYTHRHRVDAIYIDPPYNTGAKDWKYNNDYVASDDDYRHSKWLAFMERRLKIARELLNPDNSVLIVTIDEKEYLRLGLLLEQTFPEARVQMISNVISTKGSARAGEFSRCNEFVYFVMFGASSPQPQGDDMLREEASTGQGDEVEWGRLKRNGANGSRTRAKSLFYPIFLNEDATFHSVGRPLDILEDRHSIVAPPGTYAVFPVLSNGREMSWGLSGEKVVEYAQKGYIKFGQLAHDKHQKSMIYYLTSGYVEAAENGKITQIGTVKNPKWVHGADKGMKPLTIWFKVSHDAGWQGSRLLAQFLPDRRFPFPKSLYAVEDALRFFVADKPDAVILDFFSGSGTTAHAVMRLNRQDGGRRQSILVTNNEVAAEEHKKLRQDGLRPGDPDWEQWGICDHITKPRIRAAITGETPDGDPIKGDYKFTDEFPMSEGFEENAAFFTLTYEAPLSVSHHKAFQRIAPLLWLRAGSQGRIIDDLGEQGWDIAERYGVLQNLDGAGEFFAALAQAQGVQVVYVITDDDAAFQMVCRDLPGGVTSVRLYESYLHNFQINSGRAG